ncbi:hypothetical protein CsSME_00001052 [Camellia sinensis var. sinensis]
MARSNQEAIETFMSITGPSESVALQKLEQRLTLQQTLLYQFGGQPPTRFGD